ncbi:MAG: PHP domain-containing protein [Polyangiaceae bacterium]|nr:PHP domain-containing protein [Polyangiaceae bacterium]
MRSLGLIPFAALVACSGAQDGTLVPPTQPCPTVSTSAKAQARPIPAPPPAAADAEGKVTVAASRDDIPLAGPRVFGEKGDLVLDNGKAVVVVTQEGRIADFGAKNGRDELSWFNPTASVGLSTLDAPVVQLAPSSNGKVIVLERALAGKPALLISWIWLTNDVLHVESVVENTGDDPALAVTLGERVSWGNVPTWMDGHGYVKDGAKLRGGFLARDTFGVAYALCSQNGPFFAKYDEPEYAGLFESALNGEVVELVPSHGRSGSRKIALSVSSVSMMDAVFKIPCRPTGGPSTHPIADVPIARAKIEVRRCGSGSKPGKPVFEHRGVAGDKPETTKFASLLLPAGCHQARLTAPGHVPGPWGAAELLGQTSPAVLPKAGKLAFSITENGQATAARLVVRGAGNENPNWGDDAEGTGAASNVIAAEKGTGEVPLPPGKYKVLVTHGFEYTAHEQAIEIKDGKTTSLKATLSRVVDTLGWMTADLHLHAEPSGDAPSLLSDRVRSLLAAGVEIAVATDHNAVTDYKPTIASLGQTQKIASVIGDEITTRDTPFGHFNAFPLDAKTPPIKYKHTTPAAIFGEVRGSKPYGKDTILQVNHPKMGSIGYFEILRFDGENIPEWLKRSPLADMGFDALEVFNGDHYTRIAKVEEVLKDWYALLNAGYRVTATGNSDSHRISFHDPGVPTNLVQVGNDDPAKFDERVFVNAVRAGRVVISSGPFVNLTIGDKGVGDTVAPGEVEVVVHVDAPPWVELDEVTLIKRGNVIKTWAIDKKAGKRPWKWMLKDTLKADDWVIAIARGKKPMAYLYRSGALPFGFTNPIFVK